MLNDSDSDKFLYKVKKWGDLHPDVNFVLYTDHSAENSSVSSFDFTIVAVVEDALDFTRKLHWINYFGQTTKHLLHTTEENHTIEVDYKNGPMVKFVFFDSEKDSKTANLPHSRILVNKR